MLNFAGQDIQRGDFVGQVARTNQGMRRRVGVVFGTVVVPNDPRGPIEQFRVIWATLVDDAWEYSDGNVAPDTVFHIDGDSINYGVFLQLSARAQQGHA